MGIAISPPKGGIVADVAGKERILILRNEEIERFEAQHGIGIFAVLDQLLGRRASNVQARHCRDLVALGLVGGGLPARVADDLVSSLPPSHNVSLRQIALDLVVIAFTPEVPQKKSEEDGSSLSKAEKVTDGTSQGASETSPEQA